MNEERAAIEKSRHQCEVRFLISASNDSTRGQAWAKNYLQHPRVAGRREALANDVKDQINKGHDGREGLWL